MICPTPPPATYNTTSYASLEEIRAWRDKTGFPIAVFENFDAGGFNHYIIELYSEEAFRSFTAAFEDGLRSWGEDALGNEVPWIEEPEPAYRDPLGNRNHNR